MQMPGLQLNRQYLKENQENEGRLSMKTAGLRGFVS